MIGDLEREGLIKRLPVNPRKVEDSLDHAHRDLATSRAVLQTDSDWAYTIAYTAVLQAGRALMFSKGYRPDGAHQHIAVVKFAGLFLDEQDAITFDRMRRIRNSSVYETAGSIPVDQAEGAIRSAEALVCRIEACIQRN